MTAWSPPGETNGDHGLRLTRWTGKLGGGGKVGFANRLLDRIGIRRRLISIFRKTLEKSVVDTESLLQEETRLLVERYGCSPAYANGYADGKHSRVLGRSIGSYVRAGFDEYSLGFRAGYFERPTGPVSGGHRPSCRT